MPKRPHLALEGIGPIENPLSGTVSDWQTTLELIRQMRRGVVAPVDFQGCSRLADPSASPKVGWCLIF